MNISITDVLAEYVRGKVASGRYNNASEVVREALRRMEDADRRVAQLASPSVEDVLADLTADQVEGIRNRVRAGVESIGRGDFAVYEGRPGLDRLAAGIKARGRKRINAAARA
ncbi:MAG TPA: type II toxin-antitoxin system ParD family antitoxin [Terracidiphilus sp.]|nr:type II toxin-antitoxin system ParD family antitoxin [Terracidiphilus sp.]